MNNYRYHGRQRGCGLRGHKTNEVCAIYPITPSRPMGEFSDEWSALNKKTSGEPSAGR